MNDSDEDGEQQDIRDELSFLDESSSSNFRQTFPIGGASSIDPHECGTENQPCGSETAPTSTFSYMARKSKRANETSTLDAAAVVSQSIASFIEKRGEKKDELKNSATWSQLEKLYEQLDVDKITDLNFSFISQAYAAVVERRNANK